MARSFSGAQREGVLAEYVRKGITKGWYELNPLTFFADVV